MKIKCIDNKGNEWFKVGKVYKAWKNTDGSLWSESDCGVDCFHVSMNNSHGVFEMVEEEKSHPHADLMLKYAMIAQYDDKPWECFECDPGNGMWCDMFNTNFHTAFNYRLKPQEPEIKVGQIWVSKEGVDVEVVTPAISGYVTTGHTLGGNKIHWSFLCSEFLQNFKRKV